MMVTMCGDSVRLRQLELQDAEAMEALLAGKEVASTTLGIPYPYPAGSSASFIQSRQEAAASGDRYAFAVLNLADDTFMGVIGLLINKRHRHAELSYWIGKPYWGRGYCTEAGSLALRYAFEALDMNRVWAAAMTRNPASSKVMEKLGMKHEGVLRQQILKWDVYEDLTYYGMLRSEWDGGAQRGSG